MYISLSIGDIWYTWKEYIEDKVDFTNIQNYIVNPIKSKQDSFYVFLRNKAKNYVDFLIVG